MKIDPAPRDLGRLVDDALILYRSNIRTLVMSSLAVLFPVLLLAGVTGSVYYSSTFDMLLSDPSGPMTGYGMTPDELMVLAVLQFALYVSVPLRLVTVAWIGAGVFRAVPDWMAGRGLGMKGFLKGGAKRLLHLGVVDLGVGVVAQLALLGAAVFFFLVSIPAGAFLFAAGPLGALVALAVWIVTGIVAFMLWMLALSRFMAWGPAVVMEDGGIGRSLARSMSLSKGRAWHTVWYWMSVWMVSYALRSALYAPAAFVLIDNVLPFIQDPQAATAAFPLWAGVLLGVSAAAAEALVAPFERLCWSQYYLDLRSRVEGMDLVVRARELAGART